MAVVSVTEMWPGRGASDDIEKRTQITHVYRVVTDSIDDDATVAGGTSLLPRLGDPHPNYPDAYVVLVDPRQLDEDPNLWDVTIQYSSELPNRSGTGGSGIALGPGPESMGIDSSGQPTANSAPTEREVNPLNRPAVWRWHLVEVEEPLIEDALGDPIKNSAGLPFDPPLMWNNYYVSLTVIKNVVSLSLPTVAQYHSTTNETTWKGIPAGKALLLIEGAAFDFENGVTFQQVTVEVRITRKPDGWLKKVYDAGFYKRTDLGSGAFAWERLRDSATGLVKTEPTLLDGTGQPLDDGEDPVLLSVQVFSESEFHDFFALIGVS